MAEIETKARPEGERPEAAPGREPGRPQEAAPIRLGEAALAVACGALLAAVLQNIWGLLRLAKASEGVLWAVAISWAAIALGSGFCWRRHLRRALTDRRMVACAALALALWLASGSCFAEEGPRAPQPDPVPGMRMPRPEEVNEKVWPASVLSLARILGLTDPYYAWPACALLGFLGLSSLLAVLRARARGLAGLARRAAHLGVPLVLAGALVSQLAGRRARVTVVEGGAAPIRAGNTIPFALRLERLAIEPKVVEFRPGAGLGERRHLRVEPGARCGLGSLRFQIAEILPNARPEEKIVEAPRGVHAPPLFEMELVREGAPPAPVRFQPTGREPVIEIRTGIEIFHVRAAARAEHERFLSAPRPWPEEALRIQRLGETAEPAEIPLRPRAEKIGQELAHELLGPLRLRVTDWAPSGRGDILHFEPSREGRASRPAVRLALAGSSEAPFWVVSAGMGRGPEIIGGLPLELRRHRFQYLAVPEPLLAVRILEGPGEPRRLVVLGKTPEAHRFEEGDAIELPGLQGLRLRLVRAWRSAVRRPVAVPAGEGRRGLPAVLLRAEGPVFAHEAWLFAGDARAELFGPWAARFLAAPPVPERTAAEITVVGGDEEETVLARGTVRPNRPLRAGAWRVYLRAAVPPEARFAVVRDPGVPLVWPGLVLVAFGAVCLALARTFGRAEEGSPP